MSFKKNLLAAAAALSIIPAVSLAADFPITVSVEAVVPAANGLQISGVGDFLTRTQSMGWNIVTEELQPIRGQLDMKSPAAIFAYLTTDAVLTSGANSLPMSVSVHGKSLETGVGKKVEVLTAPAAGAADATRRVDVSISTAKPTGGYVEGKYVGQVFMMFESTIP